MPPTVTVRLFWICRSSSTGMGTSARLKPVYERVRLGSGCRGWRGCGSRGRGRLSSRTAGRRPPGTPPGPGTRVLAFGCAPIGTVSSRSPTHSKGMPGLAAQTLNPAPGGLADGVEADPERVDRGDGVLDRAVPDRDARAGLRAVRADTLRWMRDRTGPSSPGSAASEYPRVGDRVRRAGVGTSVRRSCRLMPVPDSCSSTLTYSRLPRTSRVCGRFAPRTVPSSAQVRSRGCCVGGGVVQLPELRAAGRVVDLVDGADDLAVREAGLRDVHEEPDLRGGRVVVLGDAAGQGCAEVMSGSGSDAARSPSYVARVGVPVHVIGEPLVSADASWSTRTGPPSASTPPPDGSGSVIAL
jgi:hypothetical protein